MSIVETSRSKHHRMSHLGGLTGAALVSTAVFVMAPKVIGNTLDYTATGTQSWFNTANWNYALPNASATGTLPEEAVPTDLVTAPNLDANNAAMPAVGVLFDPANDPLTPGGKNANYIANFGFNVTGGTSTLYLAYGDYTTNYTIAAPNKLTIESGTMEANVVTVGRDDQGILVQNGGVFISDNKFDIGGANHSTGTIGSGTFEYHGGTFIAGNQIQVAPGQTVSGMSLTSAAVGRLVVYNDGPDGAILSTNGVDFALNSAGKGTIGIVEFHFDEDPDGLNPGVRPVQNDYNTPNGELVIKNGTNLSSRLNLVLDVSPGTSLAAPAAGSTYINLGLFKDQSIASNGTWPKLFYTLNSGTTDYTQGATIAAAYSGTTYSWTISYSGVITFDNTATSAYTSADIAATGGSDVVLLGVSPVLVPEPTSLGILGGAGGLILARRRRRNKS
jgi:hypothetical protein